MQKDMQRFAKKAVIAGVVAGTLSTVAQLLLWLVFTRALPDILYRDTRMAAAIVLGQDVLQDKGAASLWVWLVAGTVHFGLSLLYAAAILSATSRLHGLATLLAGALLGAALYAINMYGFTLLFPWFVVSREAITLTAHIVFGVVAAIDWHGHGRTHD